MGKNWTTTLAERNAGRRAGFGLPADLDKMTKAELVAEAERRGIDPDRATKNEQLRDAIAGRAVLAAKED